MIVNKNNYFDIQKEIARLSDDLVTQDELANFNEHIEAKLSDFKPTLMIYGTYNAGKSTLLNALFGQEERAKTGDAPETKEIHEYEYNGYTIFDTPGLNARSEDDITTEEHLEKSEVILFVLSNNGSFEENYVYTKIAEIVKKNKPIIIVINNKAGIDPVSIEAIESMDKIGENLRKIGDRNGIEKIETKVSLCMVNAKSALKAKLENKNLLLNKSNILQLEKKVELLLTGSGEKEVINALNIFIQNFIETLVDKIDSKIDTVEVQKTEELITYLEKQRQSTLVKLRNIVTKKIPNFKDAMSSMLLNDVSEGDLNELITNTIKEIANQIENTVNSVNNDLKIKIENFSEDFKGINPEYANMVLPEEAKDSSSMIPEEVKNQIGNAIKNKKIVEEGAKKVLTLAKEYFPKNIMKGKGPAWIGKASGKIAVGLNVAIAAFDIYSATKEHQQAIQAERDRTLSAKNTAESFGDDISASLFSSIDEVVTDMFYDLILDYKSASKALSNGNSSLIEKKNCLQSYVTKLA